MVEVFGRDLILGGVINNMEFGSGALLIGIIATPD